MNYHYQQQPAWSPWKVGFAVLLLIGGFISYDVFFAARSKAQSPLVTESEGGAVTSVIAPEDLQILQKINSIVLDNSIFSDKVFQSLHDYTVQLIPEPTGRPNPFAPIPGAPVPSGQSGR